MYTCLPPVSLIQRIMSARHLTLLPAPDAALEPSIEVLFSSLLFYRHCSSIQPQSLP